MYLLGVLFIATGIGLSIALHEIGHLLPAKRFGVKVTQYMVGFGPTVWSRRRGETEYGVKAIPLGGYVRMIGMFPPARGADPSRLRSSSTGRFSQLADQARAESLQQIQPGDEDRVFYKLSTGKKALVMLGGPVMNLLIAAVLLTGYVTLYGVLDPDQPTGAKVSTVSSCVVPNPATAPAGEVDCATNPAGPAYAAGIRPGDRIVSIAGAPVARSVDIALAVRPNAGRPLPIQVERDGALLDLTVTPITGTLPTLDGQGQVVRDAAGAIVTEQAGYMGTTTRPTFALVKQPLGAAPAYLANAVANTAGVVLRIPEKMVGVAQAAFGGGERDPNGPVSVVGVGRVAGEKAGGVLTGSVIDDIDVLPFLIQLLAMLNVALFVFNLIPLMPLDGGHVAGALWEGLRRRIARARGRPDPGPVDVARALPFAYVMAVLLIGMSALLIYADIVRPIRF